MHARKQFYPGAIEERNKSPASRYMSASLASFRRDYDEGSAGYMLNRGRRKRVGVGVYTRVLRRTLNSDVFSYVIDRKKESAIDSRSFLFTREVAINERHVFLFLFFIFFVSFSKSQTGSAI